MQRSNARTHNQHALQITKRQKREFSIQAPALARHEHRKNHDPRTTLQFGRILVYNLRFAEALRAYRSLIKTKSKTKDLSHIIYNGIGNAHRCMADHDKSNAARYRRALKAYQHTINVAPTRMRGLYWSNLAATYAALKQWDKAIQAAGKSIPLLKNEQKLGIKHGNQIKILQLEIKLWREYKKRTLFT